jgi:hypothetical protein
MASAATALKQMSDTIRRERVGKLQRQQHVAATAKVLKVGARVFTLALALKLLQAMEVRAARGAKEHLTAKDVEVLAWRDSSGVWRNDLEGVVAARGVLAEELQLPYRKVCLTTFTLAGRDIFVPDAHTPATGRGEHLNM